MLDIQIFRVQHNIMDHGKKVGEVPEITIGSYDSVPFPVYRAIRAETNKLSPEQQNDIMKQLTRIGILDKASTYAQVLETATHPKVKLTMERELWYLKQNYKEILPDTPEGTAPSHDTLVAMRTQALGEWKNMGTPEQLVGVMMDAVCRYHEDELLYAEVRSALGHGIAWGVDSLKRDERLSKDLKFLKIGSKHRPCVKNGVPIYS